MKFKITQWSIKHLIELIEAGNIDLTPPYQRNFIWSKSDQLELIDSIMTKKFPLPTFFVRVIDNPDKEYEMVDGQQRTRTILSYYQQHIKNSIIGVGDDQETFLEYPLSITVVSDVKVKGSIEEFYARVNKTGRKINKPELYKAEYFYTKFLALNEELAEDENFRSLNLFATTSINRMNDIDFVSELVAFLEFDTTDKKDKVTTLYESDITIEKKSQLKSDFINVILAITDLNQVFPINKSRYKQRSDFYTLFSFVHKGIKKIDLSTLKYFYRILILISDDISPSNDDCEPFKEYAINCVSQSNSKKARLERLSFFENILLNIENKPNTTQSKVLDYYGLKEVGLIKVQDFYTLDYNSLTDLKILIFNE